MIVLTPRLNPSYKVILLSPLLALLLTIIASIFMFLMIGANPGAVLYALFIDPLTYGYTISELFLKASPLIIIGIGLSIGFRAGVWNIGAEGQYVIGALAGGAVGLAFHNVQGIWLLPLMTIAAILGGMAWAAIPAFLRTKLNVNEILVSLMLTYVAILLLSVMVHGPLRSPEGLNFPESRLFHDSATLPIIFEGARIHIGIVIAFIVVLIAWYLMKNHMLGFRINITGDTPKASHFAGFSANQTIWGVLLLSGGLAGMAGLFEATSTFGQLVPHFPAHYGFTAIIVAFLGRLHPIGIIFSALLIALTYIGGENAQIMLNLPNAITRVFQGMLLFFFLACDIIVRYEVSLNRRKS
ncbi:MAG: ABC transporter permease [Alphaproteobacteria bacterium]|nr:ABC transporter permease [Alphaproteobacteria bacterium]